MANPKNAVIAGDYLGGAVVGTEKILTIAVSFTKSVPINKETVETYEVLTDEKKKSVASGIARGIVGGWIFGPVGMIGGAILARSTGTYQVAVKFKSGEKSLLELDDKLYKLLVKSCF